jgi:hypothetical protein
MKRSQQIQREQLGLRSIVSKTRLTSDFDRYMNTPDTFNYHMIGFNQKRYLRGGGGGLSDSGDVFEWEDLFDQILNISRSGVQAYNLPTLSSSVVRTFSIGDPVWIFSYLYVQGKVWIQFYNSIADYENFNASWIPLNGNPGTDLIVPVSTIASVFNVSDIKTQGQEDAEEAAANETTWDKAGNLLTTAAWIIGGSYVLGSVVSNIK